VPRDTPYGASAKPMQGPLRGPRQRLPRVGIWLIGTTFPEDMAGELQRNASNTRSALSAACRSWN
jgi:hypothetical protein